MKRTKVISAMISAAVFLGIFNITPTAKEPDGNMADSGINYTESTETLNNPGAGYTSTLWYNCKPGNTPVHDPTGNLVLMFIDIGAFSSGVNGTTDDSGNYTEGTDYDLDNTFFEGLRATFENCRKNGCTIAVRFRYDANGKDNPEPASFEKVLRHISQIKESGLLEDYKDILMFVESGFVGKWGEQHGGKYTSLEDKAQLLDAMLDCVPDPIPVTVRTPNIVAKWADIPANQLDTLIAEEGSEGARIGLYNDGYMGSDSDLGTFANRKIETDWMNHQMLTSYYGGEFSGNLDWAKKYDTYLPENAIPEMYKTHLSYINSNIYSLYKDYTFSEQYSVEGADNTAYYGQTVFKFIRDHLGYRFVLRDSDLTQDVEKGGELNLDFTVENTGFANPIRSQKAELILERDGNYVKTDVDIDTTKWYSCQESSQQLSMKLPGELDTGKWNAYIRFSVGDNDISQGYMRSVKFANDDIWNAAIGANYLGSFNVTETDDAEKLTDNSYYQLNSVYETKKSDGEMFTVNNIIILDGTRSGESEWTDSLLCLESDNNKLYMTSDDKNFYIMAEIEQNASSPVYNLQIRHGGEFYWMYYTQGGFVYYNKGSYDGCMCKRTGKYVEFKIPFGSVMNLSPDTTLESVRVSIQDEANDWKVTGDLKSGEYTIPANFDVYTSARNICVMENGSLTLNTEVSPKNASYQWYFNDSPISGANKKNFMIESASAEHIGSYSVEITSEEGIVKMVNVCNIQQVYQSALTGDVNDDGKVNVSDLVLMKKYIVCSITGDELNLDNADTNSDGLVNVFDVFKLRRILLQLRA